MPARSGPLINRRSLVLAPIVAALGCKARQREFNLYIDPDPYVTYRVVYYFSKETSVRVNQRDLHDRTGALTTETIIKQADHPWADLYWASDAMRCEVLKQKGLALAYRSPSQIGDDFRDSADSWIGFAARLMVLLVRSGSKTAPDSVLSYADPVQKGRGSLADPLHGMMRSYFASLAVAWGDRQLSDFYAKAIANGTRLTKTSQESAAAVEKGDCDFTLVESDVALESVQRSSGLEIVYPDQLPNQVGVMPILNALMILKGCKEPQAARQFIDYVTSIDGELRVVQFAAYEVPVQDSVGKRSYQMRHLTSLHCMHVDYPAAAQKLLAMDQILPAPPKG